MLVLQVVLLGLLALCYASAEQKVHVGSLNWDTSDDALRMAFEPYGTIVNSVVIKNRETGGSRGFGFVTFETLEQANAAIAALNEEELDGQRIRVSLVRARA